MREEKRAGSGLVDPKVNIRILLACGSDGVQSGGRARLAVGCDLFDLGEVGDDI